MVSMSKFRARTAFRPLVIAGSAALLAACSSDFQRLSEYPPVNQTGSVSSAAPADNGVSSSNLSGTSLSTNTRPSWQTGYAASSATQPASTPPTTASRTATGTVRVQPGQTLYSISRANNLTVGQMAAANNLPVPYTLKVGQTLVVPGVSNPSSPAATFRPANAPVATKNFAGTNIHRVSAGETLFAVGRAYSVHPYKIAEHNSLSQPYSLRVGQELRIPSGGSFASAPANPTRPAAQTVAAQQPQQYTTATKDQAQISQPVAKVEQPIAQAEQAVVGGTDTGAGFRWPVKGRVISKYGSKPNGTRNEGINIAVPEGADIRASEAGVVAYSGNELKGYGNLVLIRHADGWVTAYAHSKEVFVKRGDTVRRGQIIAKAGATGSVTSPQLHFELRKGASAVDPERYLARSTASN